METCPTCNLQYQRENKSNHALTITVLAAISQYFSRKCKKKIINLADKSCHLQSDEHKIKKSWYFEVSYRDKNIIPKFSTNKSTTHEEKEVISRINNNLTDKTYTNVNPEFNQVDGLIKRATDGCGKNFQ